MINIERLSQGMTGSRVSDTLYDNFDKLRTEIYQLRNEIDALKTSAMAGNNGAIIANASVSISYTPTSIMSRVDTVVNTYTVNVKVMCGQNELVAGTDNKVSEYTAALENSEVTGGGMVIAKITQNITGGALSYTVAVQPNAISDSTFTFYITFNDVVYMTTIPIMLLNQETGFDYAQGLFVSTVFKRSSLSSLPVPFGGSYESPLPRDYDGEINQGWSDGIPSGTDPLWCCHRKFTSDGKSPQEDSWSTPVLAMDSADFDVCYSSLSTESPEASDVPSKHGSQDGDTSKWQWHDTGTPDDVWMATSVKSGNAWGAWSILKIKGESGINSDWKNTIYKNCEDEEGPLTPTGTSTDFIDNTSILDKSDPNYGWHDVPSSEGTWWMSCAYIKGETQVVSEAGWSKPVKVSGGEGQAVFVSTIFMRCATQPDKPASLDGNFDSPIPSYSYGPSGELWSDGIPADTDKTGNPLWSCHRIFTSNDASPQEDEWSTPQLMVDTADFDCCYTAYDGTPGDPSCHGDQDKDTSGYNWHNTGSSADTWMATSYKTATSDWSSWTITRIKGESGADGNYTNYIFKSSSANTITAPNITNPNNFVGKTYGEVIGNDGQVNIEECNQGWEDGPGIGTSWWMSCGVIEGSTGRLVVTNGWSTPTKLNGEKGADGSYTEYQYTIDSDEMNHPTAESAWCDSVSGALDSFNTQHGTHHTTVPTNYYMWMRFRRWYIPDGGSELVCGSWEYARITGEKGEDGTKMTVNGTKDSYDELFSIASNPRPNSAIKTPPPTDGESWIVKGELWVWSESTDDDVTDDTYSTTYYMHKWRNCGSIVGPSGTSQYMHIKYAKILDKEKTEGGVTKKYPSQAFANPDDCNYIGVMIDANAEAGDGDLNNDDYTWSKFTGSDGYGYEFIYKLSNVQKAPDVPTSANTKYDINGNPWNDANYQKNDFIPSGWTDNPSGTNSGTPWEYMAKRVRTNGIWEPFKGSASDNTKASLYSYYGKDANRIERQWAAIDSLLYVKEKMDAATWRTVAPEIKQEENLYTWERTREVEAAHGICAETYSDWVYIRVGGEKGNTGTGIQLKGGVNSYEELFRNAYDNSSDGYHGENGYYDSDKLNDGDAWTLSGNVWSWATSNDDHNTDESAIYGTRFRRHHFSNCGALQGTPGETNYLHIKYAKMATFHSDTKTYSVDSVDWLTEELVDDDGEKIGNFIGMCTTADKDDPSVLSAYTWSPYGGADGIDYEVIYTRTANNIDVHVPSISDSMFSSDTKVQVVKSVDSAGTITETTMKKYQSTDFVPYTGTTWRGEKITNYNWTDNPLGPTEALPYEWACKREKKNGTWGIFIGKASDTDTAFLYNKYGMSATEIELSHYTHTYIKLSGNTGTQIDDVKIEITAARDHLTKDVTDITIASTPSTLINKFTTHNTKAGNPGVITLVNSSELLSGGFLTFTFKVEGVEYTKNFEVVIGSDNGKNGKNGENGVSPILYEIFPDPDIIKYNSAGTCSITGAEWPIKIYKTSGGTRSLLNFGASDLQLKYIQDESETEIACNVYSTNTNYASVPRNKFTTFSNYVNFYLKDGTDTLACHTTQVSHDGYSPSSKSSKPLRGPSVWMVGKNYEGGGEDDNFQDLVILSGNTDNMYLCIKSHLSTNRTNPGYDDEYWTVTEYTEFTATKVLFSDKASITNLVLNNAAAYPTKDGVIDTEHPTIIFDGDTGAISANSGCIGGFIIGANKLYNNNYGASILISGETASAVLGNEAYDEISKTQCSLSAKRKILNATYNTALYLDASRGVYNYAFHGNGNGVLNGYMIGYKTYSFQVLTNTYMYLRNGAFQIVVAVNSSSYKVYLPTLGEIRQTIGLDTGSTQTFAVDLAVYSTPGNFTTTLYGDTSRTINTPVTTTTAYPSIILGSSTSLSTVGSTISLTAGRLVRFKICYANSSGANGIFFAQADY